MGTSRLPDRIPIPGAEAKKDKLMGFGTLGMIGGGALMFMGAPGLGALALVGGGIMFLCGSNVRTHREAIREGKIYR